MAAPPGATINNLTGNWLMNRSLSDSPEPGLVIQGIGWMTRKAIGLASISLEVKLYTGLPTPADSPSPWCSASPPEDGVTHIDITQSASGLTSTQENRCLDGRWRHHEDWMFGKVRGRSRWLTDPAALAGGGEAGEGESGAGGGGSDDVTAGDAETRQFLAAGWLDGPAEQTGPGGARLIASYVESLVAGWTALQVWGFQEVQGERRHCRKVVVRNGDKKAMFRLAYDFLLVSDEDEDDGLPELQ